MTKSETVADCAGRSDHRLERGLLETNAQRSTVGVLTSDTHTGIGKEATAESKVCTYTRYTQPGCKATKCKSRKLARLLAGFRGSKNVLLLSAVEWRPTVNQLDVAIVKRPIGNQQDLVVNLRQLYLLKRMRRWWGRSDGRNTNIDLKHQKWESYKTSKWSI